MSETPIAPVIDLQARRPQSGNEQRYHIDQNDRELAAQSREVITNPDDRIYLDEDDVYSANHLFDTVESAPIEQPVELSHADKLRRAYESMPPQAVIANISETANGVISLRNYYDLAA